MGRHSKEYNEGYQAAIEAIKQAMEKNGGGDLSDQDLDNMSPDGLESPNGSGKGQGKGDDNNSRTSKSDENQGVVSHEDCIGPDSLGGVPDTPGGMMSKSDGDKIAEKEGYGKEGGTDESVSKDWKETALKEEPKFKGVGSGKMSDKLQGLYKTATDWKKELKKIVGQSISPDEKRQAYANKNILVSQDRIARTDKDKYDNIDYMMAWIDTSGSMTKEQMKLCLMEVYQTAIAKKPMKMVVIQCDTQIKDIKEYHDLRELKRDAQVGAIKGGGGTDFKACWDLLVNDPRYKRIPAELVMLFTDGECHQYKRNPRTMRNLCWVILDNLSFKLQYKDMNTKCIHLNTASVKV
jgi:predicted metal-dependent peptidase